jgi:hypothetical protein
MLPLSLKNGVAQKNSVGVVLCILVVLSTNTLSKHHHRKAKEFNLYLTQDLKNLTSSGEVSYIKDRLMESKSDKGIPSGSITKEQYPYNVEDQMHKELDAVDSDLKMAVQQAEKNEVEERGKKRMEGGEDDNGVDDQDNGLEPGYDEFGKRYKRDWNQPLKHEGNKCNLILMKMFKLEGRLWSRKKDTLKICPGVSENCCTYMDELVILKLWNEYSKPHIVEYVNKLIYNYSKILSVHYRIANISVREIDFHWYKSRTVTYERAVCERRDEVAYLNFNKGVVENKDALDIYYKKDDTEDKKFKVIAKVIDGSIKKEVKKEIKEESKTKRGKKGKRMLKETDPLLDDVHEYHKWKGRILMELRDSIQDTKKKAQVLQKMIDEHPENDTSQKKESDKIVLDTQNKEESPDERGLTSEVKPEAAQTMAAPMQILMAGLSKSLNKIKKNPEIKKIITRTERMKQLIKDEGMFRQTEGNAEETLQRARESLNKTESSHMSKLKLTKKETIGIRNINWLKRKFQRALSEPVQKVHHIFMEKQRKLRGILTNVSVRLAELRTRLDEKGLKQENYERILKKFPKMSSFNLWVYDQIRKGKKDIEDMPEFIVYKEDKLNTFFTKTKKTLEDMLMMEKNFLSKQKNVPIDNDFLYKFMKTLNEKDIPQVNLPFYPKRDRQLPTLPKVPINKISCFSYPVSFPRKFLIFNPVKFEFCYKTVLKLRRFDAQVFSQYLASVRNSIFELVFLKKNIYCDLCDQPKQQFFDMENEMVYYEMGFCKTLVTQFSEYIKWKNIILIEYLNTVFNYIKCFETEAKQNVFPFTTYVAHQQRQIYFIRRCLQNLETPEYFKYCHFMCKHFNYTSFDSYFIGDNEFLKNLFVMLVSFLRKMKVGIPRDLIKEIVRGHGQFKKSKAINDHDYAVYMSDPELNPFDELNPRNTVPEHRKLRTTTVGLWGNKPEHERRVPEKFREIYQKLEKRTRGSEVHPSHGIVFEEVGKGVKRVKESPENQEQTQVSPTSPDENKERILEKKKIDDGDPDNDPDVVKDEEKYKKMKPTKEEEVEEIYDKIDTKLNPSNLRTLYIEGAGLHPIKTEGVSDFSYDIDKMIDHHYSYIKLEELGTKTLHAVVPMGAREEYNFNKDIDLQFVIKKEKEVDKDLVSQLYEKRERQRNKKLREISKEEEENLRDRLNPKKDYMDDIKKTDNDRYVETDGDKMAMPEIDILF